MKNRYPNLLNTLVAIGLTASLGAGVAACGKQPESSSSTARSEAASGTASDKATTAQVKAEPATYSKAGANTTDGMAAMKDPSSDAEDDMVEAVSDSWITTKVKALLLADSEAKGFDVSVETMNGVVILRGALRDQAAVDHAKQIAASVEGVKNVNTTALTVDGKR